MKKVFILCLSLLFSLNVASQNEHLKDSVSKSNIPEPQEQQETEQSSISTTFLQDTPDATLIIHDKITLDVPTLPTFSPNLPWMDKDMGEMVNNHSPFVMNYQLSNLFVLNNNSMLSTFSNYNTYPTMGTMIDAGANYIFKPNERWELAGGIYAAKYTMPSLMHGSQLDLGINVSAAYRINDNLRIRVLGQYSAFGRENSFNGYMNPMYPQSYYGAIMELKLNEMVEIHGGMERVYDPTKMKWKTIPVLYPVIHLRKKK